VVAWLDYVANKAVELPSDVRDYVTKG
jgi:hypothetical protein